jgi:tellurite methyltransferase
VKLKEWDARYRTGEAAFDAPTPLVIEIVQILTPGHALDLACGAGRNAIFLAQQGWQVTAVDGSAAAIETLRGRAQGALIDAVLTDLQRGAFPIAAEAYDLILASYYLQRDLLPAMMRGVKTGGILAAIVHLGEQATPRRVAAGELRSLIPGWEILHDYEGEPRESCHRQPVAEIAARKL